MMLPAPIELASFGLLAMALLLQCLGLPRSSQDSQVEAVSLGKEKPKATGNTEADYAENRRADILYNGE